MAGKYENYESFDISDAAWSSSTITINNGGNKGGYWSVPICPTCNTSPCSCSVKASWSIGGTADEKLDLLLDKLGVCQVCGAEDCFVLCSICVEAVKLARNRWLDEFRKEIAAMAD